MNADARVLTGLTVVDAAELERLRRIERAARAFIDARGPAAIWAAFEGLGLALGKPVEDSPR